jgi:hypothetical protein
MKIRVAGATPTANLGVVEPPHAQGDGPATPKRPKNKKKKRRIKMGFGLLGVAGPPPRAWGMASTTPYDWYGPRPLGKGRPPLKSQNPF